MSEAMFHVYYTGIRSYVFLIWDMSEIEIRKKKKISNRNAIGFLNLNLISLF